MRCGRSTGSCRRSSTDRRAGVHSSRHEAGRRVVVVARRRDDPLGCRGARQLRLVRLGAPRAHARGRAAVHHRPAAAARQAGADARAGRDAEAGPCWRRRGSGRATTRGATATPSSSSRSTRCSRCSRRWRAPTTSCASRPCACSSASPSRASEGCLGSCHHPPSIDKLFESSFLCLEIRITSKTYAKRTRSLNPHCQPWHAPPSSRATQLAALPATLLTIVLD